MEEKFNASVKKITEFVRKAMSVVEVRFVLCAIVTVIFAEILSTGSSDGLSYPFRHPAAFICAILILFCSYSLSSFFPCRLGVFIIIECFWLGLAIANKVLLSFRVNPLSAVDFKIVRSVFSIISIYLSLFEIILILTSIAAAIALAVFIIIKLPKKKPDFKSAAVFTGVSAVLTVVAVLSSVALYASDMRKMRLPDVYKEFGFVYSLSMSVYDRGITRPDGYSEQNISTIIRPQETDKTEIPDSPDVEGDLSRPNVIFVQLESFFDPSRIKGLKLSEDAIPNFRRLAKDFPSGKLNVPVAGAGTVNTEFEVLCGIPVSVFGIGEYPYETYLTEKPCESLAYYFTKNGMTAHSMHNHTGTFYSRHIVMQNLGFDTFTPVEYMSDVKRNMNAWAKDKILEDEIVGSLKSTDGADFVYAISVQAHGKYVTVPGDFGSLKVSGNYPEGTLCSVEYYVNQLKDTDTFVGDLIESLENLDEDTVVVLFGDHQPSLEFTEEELGVDSIYETEYVIWSNCGVTSKDVDLEAYRLGAHVMSLLGMDDGVISRFHNTNYGTDTYEDDLNALAYDILMGEQYAYGGSFPYTVPVISYGWQSVKSTGAYIKNETLFVIGDNFTESSVIYVGGRRRDTVYINENMILTDNISSASDVKVAQVAESGYLFSEIRCKIISEPD